MLLMKLQFISFHCSTLCCHQAFFEKTDTICHIWQKEEEMLMPISGETKCFHFARFHDDTIQESELLQSYIKGYSFKH